jgi:GDP-L-fucose synthase
MRILLLGDNGFVGRNIGEILTQNGIEWHGASRSSGLDAREPREVEAVLRQITPDLIINCAAHGGSLNYVSQKAADVIEDNSLIGLALYRAVAKEAPEASVINPLAACSYPATDEVLTEGEWMNGPLHHTVMPFGSTRRLLYWIGESFRMQHGIRSVYFLLPNMYGPHDSTDPNKAHALNALTAKFVKATIENAPEVEVWGTGIAIREWLFASDFGRIILEFVRNPDMAGLSEPLNIGQRFGLSVRELVDTIRDASGYEGQVRYDPSKPDGAPKKVLDDKRFRTVFPDFKFTSQLDGVAACVDFYQRSYPY